MSRTEVTAVASALASAVLIAALPGPAAAQPIAEPLMYPGSNCVSVTSLIPTFNASTDAGRLSKLHGRITNNTAFRMLVQCPMYDRGNTFAGRIWVIDNNEVPGQDIVCCSKTRNPLGGDIANQCKVTAGSSDTPMQLDFDGPSATLTFTYRFFDCVLPPGTAIINYRGLAK